MTHAPTIRRLFALEHAFRPRPPMPPDLVDRARPAVGQITLITGPSGGGKSSLLTAMRQALHADAPSHWIEPAQIRLPDACVIDCLCQVLGDDASAIERALELLGRVGLAEAWTYLQKPSELSDGQRWRLMLAMAVATATRSGEAVQQKTPETQTTITTIIAMDEFAALLDRITARVVARALRRLIRPTSAGAKDASTRLAAIVATSHDDLAEALLPDTVVHCDFDVYTVRRTSDLSHR